jgi:hypothetical protein
MQIGHGAMHCHSTHWPPVFATFFARTPHAVWSNEHRGCKVTEAAAACIELQRRSPACLHEPRGRGKVNSPKRAQGTRLRVSRFSAISQIGVESLKEHGRGSKVDGYRGDRFGEKRCPTSPCLDVPVSPPKCPLLCSDGANLLSCWIGPGQHSRQVPPATTTGLAELATMQATRCYAFLEAGVVHELFNTIQSCHR